MFDDLKLKVTAEAAIQELGFQLAALQGIARNCTELEGRKGQAVVIPDFSGLTEAAEMGETNHYQSGTNEVDGKVVTLDKLFVKSLEFDDADFGDTEVRFFVDGGKATAYKIAKAVNGYIWGQINPTNVTKTDTTLASITKANVAKLFQVAAENDIDVGSATVAVNPATFAGILNTLGDYSIYGGTEVVQKGVIPGAYGFKQIICTDKIDSSENTIGAIVGLGSIAYASRYNKPGIEGAYPFVGKAVDPLTGITLGFRYSTDLKFGKNYLACDALVGAKVVSADKIVRLTK